MEGWEWSKHPTVMLKHEREALWAVERLNRKNVPHSSVGLGTCWWDWRCVCVEEDMFRGGGDMLVGKETCWWEMCWREQ